MEIAPDAPKGAELLHEGLYYKRGHLGKWFLHNGFDWIRSEKSRYKLDMALEANIKSAAKRLQKAANSDDEISPLQMNSKQAVLRVIAGSSRSMTVNDVLHALHKLGKSYTERTVRNTIWQLEQTDKIAPGKKRLGVGAQWPVKTWQAAEAA